MELKWLEDFLSIANTRSFSRSAEERNVTQPAFSRRIKALERWVGVELVDRSRYPTALTAAGEIFRGTAEGAWRELHQARDELRGRHRQTPTTVAFAALHTLALTFFPTWLKRLEERLGALVTRMTAENLHDCVQALMLGDCDFLLSFAHPAVPIFLDPVKYPSAVIATEAIVPVTGTDDAGRPLYLLPGSAAAPISYLAYSADSFLGRIAELIAAQSDTQPCLLKTYENSMAEALRAMVLQKHGFAWLPESCVQADFAEGRLAFAGDVKWQMQVEVRIYYSAERTRPETARLWMLALELANEDGMRTKAVAPTPRRCYP